LLEDDLHEGPEPRRPIPEWRCTVQRYDRGEVRVPARELGDAFCQRVSGQLRSHIDLTNHPEAL